MKYYIFSYLLLLPAGFTRAEPANFPQCANDCLNRFNNGTNIGNCAVSDFACVCTDSSFQEGWACCVTAGCDSANSTSSFGTMESQCPSSPNIGICAVRYIEIRDGTAETVGAAKSGVSKHHRFPGKGSRRFGHGGLGGGHAQTSATPNPVTVTTAVTTPVTIQNPVTVTNSVPVTSPITIPSTITATLLQTSVLTSSQIVIVTSIISNAAAAASSSPSTILLTSTSLVEQTSVSSTESIETTSAVSQATFTEVATITTASPSATPTALAPAPILTSTPTDTPQPSQPMTSGAKAGIAIAVLVTVGLIATGIFFFIRWRRRVVAREIEELRQQRYSARPRPESRATLYPRVQTTVSTGVAPYRDIFDKPGSPG